MGTLASTLLICACHSFAPIRATTSQDMSKIDDGKTQVSAEPPRLGFEVIAEESDIFTRAVVLRCKVMNRSNRKVAIYTCSLPWEWEHALHVRIEARNATETQHISGSFAISDPAYGVAVLEPGEVLEGTYDLRRWCRGLRTLPPNFDLLIHWSWEPHVVGGGKTDRFEGELFVPCRGGTARDVTVFPFSRGRDWKTLLNLCSTQ